MLFVSGLLLDETILTGIEIDAAFGVSSIAEEIARTGRDREDFGGSSRGTRRVESALDVAELIVRAGMETDDFGVCSTGTD